MRCDQRLAASASLLLVLACAPPGGEGADAGAPDTDAAVGDAGDGADAADTTDAGLELADHAVTFDASNDGTCTSDPWIAAIQGQVVDEDGVGIGGAMAQLCVRTSGPTGRLVCVRPQSADAAGFFTIAVPEAARCMARATLRALLPESGRAATYCEVDLCCSEGVLQLEAPLVLVDTRDPAHLPSLGDESQERTVVFASGLELDVVPARYFGDSYEALSGRRVDPASSALCFIGQEIDFEALQAFSPEGDVRGEGFAMRIPNGTGLPAGTAVDLYVLGGLSCTLADGSTVPEGQWARFGAGTVRADGDMIEASGADGLPCLGWLGYARAQ